MQLSKCQKEFKQMILQPDLAQSFGKKWLHNFHGISAEERLNVYRNNIFRTLTSALSAIFPLCEKLIGENTFKQIAHQYIHHKFPTEANLNNYGDEFSSYIQTIPKIIKNVPYLSDIANYEWLCSAVYLAPSENIVTQQDLEAMNEKKFAKFPLSLTSAFGIIRSSFPLKEMIEYIHENPDNPMNYVKGPHYFLIYRFAGEVIEEEISEIFYKGLQFLKSEKPTQSQTIIELNNFMTDEKQQQEVGPFIHFLFNHKLIKKA